MSKLARTTTIIELHVPDFVPVKSFYENIGFKVLWEYPAKNKKGYLMIQLEDNLLGFYCGTREVYDHDYFKRFERKTPRGYGVEIGIFVINPIEEYYAKVVNLYPKNVVQKLRAQPWGQRDYRIVDPFGFYLRFSEPSDMSKP